MNPILGEQKQYRYIVKSDINKERALKNLSKYGYFTLDDDSLVDKTTQWFPLAFNYSFYNDKALELDITYVTKEELEGDLNMCMVYGGYFETIDNVLISIENVSITSNAIGFVKYVNDVMALNLDIEKSAFNLSQKK